MKIKFLKIYFIIICFFSLFKCISQEINGTIFDENKNPIQGISVYLDGTTTGAITDSDGKFRINSQKINTSLVISSIGYKTIYINNPFENNNQKFYLTLKNESLQEIVIRKELFSRKQKMLVFRTFFLGNTKAGRSCKILNEDDIDLEYDYEKNILTATSNNPIQILNNYLGYEVGFTIYQFNIQFSAKSINGNDVYRSMFLGTTFYKSTSETKKFIDRRKKVFYGSKSHFFKNLTQNIWDKKNFLLFKGSYQTNPIDHFLVEKESDLFKISILNNDLSKIMLAKDVFKSSFNLLYKKSSQSKVIFSIPIVYIDNFGNNSDGDKIEFSGIMSESKIGDLLPINYEP